MKIEVTEHERNLIVAALQSINTLIAVSLSAKIYSQDAADDGPEVDIVRTPFQYPEGWDD